MIRSPLCLTVSTVIGTFHSKGLEKSKNRAKVYIFCVSNHLPTVWFLSQSCLLLTAAASLLGFCKVTSHPGDRVLIALNFQALLKGASVTKNSFQIGF